MTKRVGRSSFDRRRREFLERAGAVGVGALLARGGPLAAATMEQPFANGARELVTYPGKRPLLRITSRPPHLETPFSAFAEGAITPNDAFFVRYHLGNLPSNEAVDPAKYRLEVAGSVRTPLRLTLAELKKLAAEEVVAVNQCSGNSRGFFEPRVFGAQLGNGSMGNARWVGVPLKAVLEKAGVTSAARQVTFDGLDSPVLPSTSDYIKALPIEHALSPEVLLAWSMNGADLPYLNGYPLRLIVPGYFGTYWVKHLSKIEVLDKDFEGHDAVFMTTGYRVPDNDCWCVPGGAKPERTTPITRLKVRSFVTSLPSQSVVTVGARTEIRGIAFDSGSGIRRVQLSSDGGRTWTDATLGRDLGRYSFREWTSSVSPSKPGAFELKVRAVAQSGEMQPDAATWNPAGYARNVIESVSLIALPEDASTLTPSQLPGYRTAQLKCGLCHSADYINLQPRGLTTAQWSAEMVKMQKTYGAPLSDEEVAQLAEYLAAAYPSR